VRLRRVVSHRKFSVSPDSKAQPQSSVNKDLNFSHFDQGSQKALIAHFRAPAHHPIHSADHLPEGRMKNSHERLGKVGFVKQTQKYSYNVSTHCERYASGSDGTLDLLSFFGNDAEVASIHAAIFKEERLSIKFPGEKEQYFAFEKDPSCYRSAIQMPGMKTKLRHLVVVSQRIVLNGTAGVVFALANEPHIIWNTLVHSLGLPASPEWATWIYEHLQNDKLITPLASHGLDMVAIKATRDDMLRLIKRGVRLGYLPFPDTNHSTRFPRIPMRDALEGHFSAVVSPELAAVSA
jgi:hypothetical protein